MQAEGAPSTSAAAVDIPSTTVVRAAAVATAAAAQLESNKWETYDTKLRQLHERHKADLLKSIGFSPIDDDTVRFVVLFCLCFAFCCCCLFLLLLQCCFCPIACARVARAVFACCTACLLLATTNASSNTKTKTTQAFLSARAAGAAVKLIKAQTADMPLNGGALATSLVRRTRVVVVQNVAGKGLQLAVEDAGTILLQDHLVLEMCRAAALLDPEIAFNEQDPISFEDLAITVSVLEEGIDSYGGEEELMTALYNKILGLKAGSTVFCYAKDLTELLPDTMAKVRAAL